MTMEIRDDSQTGHRDNATSLAAPRFVGVKDGWSEPHRPVARPNHRRVPGARSLSGRLPASLDVRYQRLIG